jgi:hypothetical protein
MTRPHSDAPLACFAFVDKRKTRKEKSPLKKPQDAVINWPVRGNPLEQADQAGYDNRSPDAK